MIDDLLKKYQLVSDQVTTQELKIILKNLETVLNNKITGGVIEMGCYTGTTSLFISRLLKQKNVSKQFHVYDSFEGLPEKSSKDSSPAGIQFVAGELKASKKDFINNYKKAGLNLPVVHKCWFENLKDSDLPEQIAFAFLDGDYYESIKSCLNLIDDKLSSGAVVVVDDYQNEALPGAKKAVDEWISNKKYTLKIEQSLAILSI